MNFVDPSGLEAEETERVDIWEPAWPFGLGGGGVRGADMFLTEEEAGTELGGDGGGGCGPQEPPAEETRAGEAYGRLPLCFEPNRGQTDGRVRFVSRVGRYNLFLTSDEAVFALHPARRALRMRLAGANKGAAAEGLDPLPGVSNYLVGNDRSRWLTNVPGFARVLYRGVYPGVNLVYYGRRDGRLEYDLLVSPGADASRLALDFKGARRLRLDAGGDLVLHTAAGEVQARRLPGAG